MDYVLGAIDAELDRLQKARDLLTSSTFLQPLASHGDDQPAAEEEQDAAPAGPVPVTMKVLKSRTRRERTVRPRRREPEQRALGSTNPAGWVAVAPRQDAAAKPVEAKNAAVVAPPAKKAEDASEGTLEAMIRELKGRGFGSAI